MARFVVMTGSEDGHFYPSMPIVRMLLERGHEVVWYTGQKYEGKITALGARFHPLPFKTDSSLSDMYVFHPGLKGKTGLAQSKYYLKHIFLDACEPEMAELKSILEGFRAHVLVGDTITFSIYFLAEITGLPSAMISLLPLALPDKYVAPFGMGFLPGTNLFTSSRNRLLNLLADQILLKDVTRYANFTRKKLGLPPLDGPFLAAAFRKPTLIMHLSTPAFEYPRSRMPASLQFIGPVLKEKDSTFMPPPWWGDLAVENPVILINQGTIAKDLHDLVLPAIQALKDEPMLVVAVPVKPGQVKDAPSNLRIEPFIPFDHLLPHVAMMVTNGGLGGVQLALAHGVPLVVAGNTDDKMEVAARVEWSKSGINLRKQRPTAGEIRKAVLEVLHNPLYQQNARRIQAGFAKTNAPLRAAELLEDLVLKKELTLIKTEPEYGVFHPDIPYVSWGSARKKMLILAGGPGNSVPAPFVIQNFYREYDPFLEEYTVYLVTRRKGQPQGFSTRDMSDDYAAMIEHDFGGHVEVIIGTSMGGMIAQHFAADHAGLVDHLVIAIAAHKMSEAGRQIDLKYAQLLSRGKSRKALLVIADALYPPGFMRTIYKSLFWLLGGSLLGEQHASYRQDVMVEARAELEHDSLQSLARINIPVLLICGDQDIYFPKKYYQELASLIKGSTLKMYTGKGHMNTLEDKAFVKDMFDFIGKCS